MKNAFEEALQMVSQIPQSVGNFFNQGPNIPYLSPIPKRDIITQTLPAGFKSPIPQSQIVPHRIGSSAFEQALGNAKNNAKAWGQVFGIGTNQQLPKKPLSPQIRSIPLSPSPVPNRVIPMPTPTPRPVGPANITIPYSQTGQPHTLKPELTQILLNAFNDIKQATNAAQVLNHPRSQTYTPTEVKRMGRESWNYGENAGFKQSNIDVPNADGSIDRGLFRVNNNTFNGIMADPHWGKLAREKFGIRSWDDMNDPQKNAYMAKLIYERQGWGAWYAAPLGLRSQGAPNLVELTKLLAKFK